MRPGFCTAACRAATASPTRQLGGQAYNVALALTAPCSTPTSMPAGRDAVASSLAENSTERAGSGIYDKYGRGCPANDLVGHAAQEQPLHAPASPCRYGDQVALVCFRIAQHHGRGMPLGDNLVLHTPARLAQLPRRAFQVFPGCRPPHLYQLRFHRRQRHRSANRKSGRRLNSPHQVKRGEARRKQSLHFVQD